MDSSPCGALSPPVLLRCEGGGIELTIGSQNHPNGALAGWFRAVAFFGRV